MEEQNSSDSDLNPAQRLMPSFLVPSSSSMSNPHMRQDPEKGTNPIEQSSDEPQTTAPSHFKVYLRMKPCGIASASNLYEVRSDKCLVTKMDTAPIGQTRRNIVSKMYSFSKIFGTQSVQKEIFEQVVENNLKKLVDGESFTLLTYGASGSGKTFTLMGTVKSPGLIPRSLDYIFKLVDPAQVPLYKPSDTGANRLGCYQQNSEIKWVTRLRHISIPQRDKYRRMSTNDQNDLAVSHIDLSNRTTYYVWVSFVEIYNECIYDLLATPDKRVSMRLREDSSGNVYVKDLTHAFVRSGEEAFDVMVAGKHNLVVAATGIHAQSSRSHSIFTITLLTEHDGKIRVSFVRLCDLAGCERQRATRNSGARMQESRAINASLHVLEKCLHMLRRKQKLSKESVVPYRESKLTRLLGPGLLGSSGEAISMVVTMNPAPQYANETKHVLSLAVVAQDIPQSKNQPQHSAQESKMSFENKQLRAENEKLTNELEQAKKQNLESIAHTEALMATIDSQVARLLQENAAMANQISEITLSRPWWPQHEIEQRAEQTERDDEEQIRDELDESMEPVFDIKVEPEFS